MYQRIERPKVTHLKAGFYGADGSGKTRTATELAIGLHKLTGSTKGILFIDTETGSDYIGERIDEAGIAFYQDKTRAFSELLRDLDEAHKVADIVVVDSVTHFFRELVASYLKTKKRSYMDLGDWGPIKTEWGGFVARFLSLPLHIIICGRLGNVYEEYFDDERSNYRTAKTGTRMAGDGETGYEPSIVFEMAKKYRKKGGTFDLRATCTKDRFDVLNARVVDFKTGVSTAEIHAAVMHAFGPHLERYAFGAEPNPVDVRTTSEAMLAPDGPSYGALNKRRKVEVEEIDGLFTRYLPGSTARERQLRTEIRVAVFRTSSETNIGDLPPERLRRGRMQIAALLHRISTDPDALPEAKGTYLPRLQALLAEIDDDPDACAVPLDSEPEDLEAMRAS